MTDCIKDGYGPCGHDRDRCPVVLTDIDLALADVDALRILTNARAGATTGFSLGSETGFSWLTRARVRIMKRILTGNAAGCYHPTAGAYADLVLNALLVTERKPQPTDTSAGLC